MSFILANFLGPNDSSTGAQNSPEMKRELIEKVCAKMTDSAHLEDRRAAAQTLKSLAHSHQLEIGTFGLQALVEELKRDGEDEETAKVCLETLNVIFSPSQDEEDAGIEVQFCEIFLKNNENVQLLVDRLDDGNFYLRFTAIQLLSALAHALPAQLQASIMASPSGVTKILQLLSDEREVVRNEGILLLLRLVALNADLQKVVAFQGAFEQLLQIVVDDGGAWEGPTSVQDALNLIAALLDVNTANQIYFRDSVCFKQLAGLLGLPDDETRELWNRNRIGNFEAALSVLSKLINRENVDLEQAQNLVLNAHYLHPLLTLSFDSKIPIKVASAALETVSDLIWRNARTQAAFADAKLTRISANVPVRLPCSPLLAATLLALHGNSQEGHEARLGALRCFDAFCSGNEDGQLAILSTLNPPPTQAEASIGSAIAEALFDLDLARKRDPWHIWMASQLLSSCLKQNATAKNKLLGHQMTEDEESVLNLLMINLIRISRDSRTSSHEKTVIGYLSLLACWLEEFPAGVATFLKEGSFLQYLIERVTQSIGFDVEVQGLGAIVLGYCVLFNDGTSTSFSSESIKGLIKNRIGPDLYISRLHRFKQSQSELLTSLKVDFESLTNLVAKPTPAGSSASHTATLASLSKELSSCRALLAETQASFASANKTSETLKIGIIERDSYILQLQKMISDKNQRIAQLAHDLSANEQQLLTEQLKSGGSEQNESALKEQNELLSTQVNQYYQQYLADQAAIEALNQSIATMQETVQAQQERIAQLEAMLEGRTSSEELEMWKKAYYELYDQIQGEMANAIAVEATEANELSEIAEQVAQVVLESPIEYSEQVAIEKEANVNEVQEHSFEPVEHIEYIESVHSVENVEYIEPVHSVEHVENFEPIHSVEHVENFEQFQSIEPVQSVEAVQVPENQQFVQVEAISEQTSEEPLVLSPSQFMSPLVSSPSTVEELHMSDFDPEPVPEFPSATNPLPNPEPSELYPSLPEAIESLPKPAVITAPVDVANEEEPLETVQFVPTNPLPDANAAIVESVYPDLPQPVIEKRASLAEPIAFATETETEPEKPEIEQVLEFFDNLPEQPESSFNASFELPSELEEIQQVIEGAEEAGYIPQFDYAASDAAEPDQSNDATEEQTSFDYSQQYCTEQDQSVQEQQYYTEPTEQEQQFYTEQISAEPTGQEQQYYTESSTGQEQQYYSEPIEQVSADQQYYTEQASYDEQSQQHVGYTDSTYAEQPQVEQSSFEQHFEQVCAENQQFEQEYSAQVPEATQEYDYSQVYYDEATNCSYGFDQSCGQHYYYDHATGEYHYYVPAEEPAAVVEAEVASNPSIPQAHGPPMVPLQASTGEGDSRQPDEVYSI